MNIIRKATIISMNQMSMFLLNLLSSLSIRLRPGSVGSSTSGVSSSSPNAEAVPVGISKKATNTMANNTAGIALFPRLIYSPPVLSTFQRKGKMEWV